MNPRKQHYQTTLSMSEDEHTIVMELQKNGHSIIGIFRAGMKTLSNEALTKESSVI